MGGVGVLEAAGAAADENEAVAVENRNAGTGAVGEGFEGVIAAPSRVANASRLKATL